jgi:myo-inositol-1(or 4)-monophosphatase
LPAIESAHRPTSDSDLDLLREAAAEAGRIALGYFGRDPEVWLKNGTSPVSAADLAADRYLQSALRAARPTYGWLSEESRPDQVAGGRTFVVDPIDGTRGFLEGSRRWCVSIAVVEAGRPIAAVLECPARRETFLCGGLGHGASKNGEILKVGEAMSPPRIGGPRTMVDALPPPLRDSLAHVAYVPSLAYRIAMVADGAMDATFVKPNAQDWDLAAADLILCEAGGALLGPGATPPRYAAGGKAHGALVAGSGALLETIRSVID